MKSMLSLRIILFLVCHHKFTLSTEHYALYKKLFLGQDYNPDLRPVKDVTQAVDVQLEYRMSFVDDLDETNEVLRSTGWLKVQWIDEFLTWNKSEFNNLERLALPALKVWGPDLVLNNDHENSIRVPKEDSMIMLFNNGNITWWAPAHWQTKCSVTVSKFPFDSQTCPIEIAQYTSHHLEVSIKGRATGKLYQMFKTHGEWEVRNLSLVTNMDDYDGEFMSRITVYVVLTRRPLYHIVTYILPVVSLSVLNLATFLVPVEYGEKVSLCVSVLLSYAVFLSTIASNLPKVSDTVSIFGIYLLAMLLVKVASCFIAVVVVKVHNPIEKDHQKVTRETTMTDGISTGQVTSADRAARINRYSFYLILSITAVVTAVFFSWMVI